MTTEVSEIDGATQIVSCGIPLPGIDVKIVDPEQHVALKPGGTFTIAGYEFKFLAAADVTGIVLTKLDGTARGGIVVAIERDLGIPVKFVGIGEGVEDLIAFDPQAFVDSLLDT